MSELEQIRIERKAAENKVALAKSLQRLEKNRDFKKLFGEVYLKEHAVNLVHSKAHPGMQRPDLQEHLDNQIAGIGHFKQFIDMVYQEGQNATTAIDTADEMLEEMQSESGEG